MTDKGYIFKGYYPEEIPVDMQIMASLNGLEINNDRIVTVSTEHPMVIGPNINLYSGRYTVKYILSIDKNAKMVTDKYICKIQITAFGGESIISEQDIHGDMFSDEGEYNAENIITVSDSANVEFKLITTADIPVNIAGITYKKAPEYDIHKTYDENGRVIRESY